MIGARNVVYNISVADLTENEEQVRVKLLLLLQMQLWLVAISVVVAPSNLINILRYMAADKIVVWFAAHGDLIFLMF